MAGWPLSGWSQNEGPTTTIRLDKRDSVDSVMLVNDVQYATSSRLVLPSFGLL